VVFTETALVVMMNPALLAPAATATEAGTLELGSLLLSATTIPPLGAGPFSAIVFMPVIELPPTTEVGYSEMPESCSGITVRVAVCVTPLYVAEIVTGVLTVTADVVMLKLGETLAPAATFTEGGTVTPAVLLVSVTTAPPAGAKPFSATKFPLPLMPPTMGFGVRFNSDMTGASTVSVAVLVTPFAEAEMVTGRLAGTGVVVITNVGDTVAPGATVTEAGKVTLESLLVRDTTRPPAGAGPTSETELEPVMPEPPSWDVGESDTDDSEKAEGGVSVRIAVTVTLL
jgi:hypothetical protein